MRDPQSAILTALYYNRREEALRLADGASLTIFEAAALGREDRIRLLLEEDPALANAWSADGYPPVSLAAFFANASTVRLFLDRGADIHGVARNDMKVQAIHAATAQRNVETVALLLDRGADPNARQQGGYTPLMAAAHVGRADLMELLLRHGADAQLQNDEGKTAAAIARDKGHTAVADRLDGYARPAAAG